MSGIIGFFSSRIHKMFASQVAPDDTSKWKPSEERVRERKNSQPQDPLCCKNNRHYNELQNWKDIEWEVSIRRDILFRTAAHLEAENAPNPLVLAATDLFIEKAQKRLTLRARQLSRYGILLSSLAFAILLAAGVFTFNTSIEEIIKKHEPLSNQVVTLLVLKATTVTAFVLSSVWYSISLARALFHEATILLNRRHALRFGRLYAFTKKGEIDWDEMERAFNWNIESSTAFKDIKPDNMAKPLATAIAQMPVEVAKALKSKGQDHEGK